MDEQLFNMLCLSRSRLKALLASLEALRGVVPKNAENRCNEAILRAGQIQQILQNLDLALCLGLQAQSSDMGE